MMVEDGRELHASLIEAWNRRDAAGFAACFADDGVLVGFDGTEVVGSPGIAQHIGEVFAGHATGRFVTVVREVRPLGLGVAMVRAIAGMIPPGATELAPQLHAVQSLVAAREGGGWSISLFQNTPAQLHGRPEAVQRITEELKAHGA
jgi:uncharacterized protein (TIGR02246 family)